MAAITEALIAYDISDDDRRARVAAYLSTFGVRLQWSVFHCQVPSGALDEIMAVAKEIIDIETDVIQAFVQCSNCVEASVSIGQVPPDLHVRYWVL